MQLREKQKSKIMTQLVDRGITSSPPKKASLLFKRQVAGSALSGPLIRQRLEHLPSGNARLPPPNGGSREATKLLTAVVIAVGIGVLFANVPELFRHPTSSTSVGSNGKLLSLASVVFVCVFGSALLGWLGRLNENFELAAAGNALVLAVLSLVTVFKR